MSQWQIQSYCYVMQLNNTVDIAFLFGDCDKHNTVK